MPPYVIMRPAMRGRPFLSCVACQSSVMVPELPTIVVRSAFAGLELTVSREASSATPAATRDRLGVKTCPLLAVPCRVPARDADAVADAGLLQGHLEVVPAKAAEIA